MHPLRILPTVAAISIFLSLLTAPLAAQVEINPYVGRLQEANYAGQFGLPAVVEEATARAPVTLGADVLLGRRQLAPLFGAGYTTATFSGPGSEEAAYAEVRMPLGIAYRLRQPDATFNLVASLAVAPTFSVTGEGVPLFREDSRGLQWNGRAGFTLYLDLITLGGHYYGDLGIGDVSRVLGDGWTFSLGVRF